MSNILLQIVTDGINAAETTKESISLLELIIKGGWIMGVLFILSIVAIFLFVERYLTIRKASDDPTDFMEEIKNKMLSGDINGAKLVCAAHNTPFSRMINKGLSRIGSPLKNIAESIENVGRIEIFKLEKNLSILATISGAAPMIGFLGTVLGMITAFMGMAESDAAVSPKTMSAGIYEAMITTAGGLVVGIIAYIGYNFLASKVSKTVNNMESASIDFIDLLQEPQK